MDPEWAKQNLDIREFCWLVTGLPRDSAIHRTVHGEWSATDENIATLTDLAVNGALTSWHDRTFNPEKYPEHKKRQQKAERDMSLPPALPHVSEIAMRPEGTATLTSLFATEPVAEEEAPSSHFLTRDELDAFIAAL